MASLVWRELKSRLNRVWLRKSETERRIEFPTGGSIAVKSADNPDSLRGAGLDYVVLDECAFMVEETWIEALRPSLGDKDGGALFISTPKGRNWFWRLYLLGQSGDDPDWSAWQKPTSDNPYIPASEIEDARRHLPAITFQQEYLAEFVEDAGLVFRNVRNCIAAPPSVPEPGHHYVMGVDWAQRVDWTALVVMDRDTRQVVAVDRFNQIGYGVQRDRLRALAQYWQVEDILAEENSMGAPIIEQLHDDGLRQVRPFYTTGSTAAGAGTKEQIIQALMLAFERSEIAIPDHAIMIGELEAYESERLPSGRWRYNAPAGMHDDTVIALALANWAAVGGRGFFILPPLTDADRQRIAERRRGA